MQIFFGWGSQEHATLTSAWCVFAQRHWQGLGKELQPPLRAFLAWSTGGVFRTGKEAGRRGRVSPPLSSCASWRMEWDGDGVCEVSTQWWGQVGVTESVALRAGGSGSLLGMLAGTCFEPWFSQAMQ